MTAAEDRMAELHAMVEAAQRVAGVLAARERGDARDAADLLASFADRDELAGGAMLVAQLSIETCAQRSGQTFEECARELSLQMEAGLAGERGPS